MPKKGDGGRQFIVTIHYIQFMPPRRIGRHTRDMVASSPSEALHSIVPIWREVDVRDRNYPDDVKVAVVIDRATEATWVFVPHPHYQQIRGAPRWKRVSGPYYTVWRSKIGDTQPRSR